MANSTKAANSRKEKKMSPVTEVKNVDPTKISGPVKRKVENPFTGEEITRIGTYTLDAATDLDSALAIVGQKESEVIFWFNYGRKLQAKAQMFNSLGFDLGSDELNELFGSFKRAMSGMLDALPKDATKEQKDKLAAKRERIQKFILSEEKFEPIREKLTELEKAGLESISIKFGNPDADGKVPDGEMALNKPSGKRGRKAKVDPNAPANADDDDSDDSEETETEA